MMKGEGIANSLISGYHLLPLTASVGAACSSLDENSDLHFLIQLADERMYMAKEGGRNRCCDGTQDKPE
jgi:GGDEF domain-containing protein